jgi:hypothetical protein
MFELKGDFQKSSTGNISIFTTKIIFKANNFGNSVQPMFKYISNLVVRGKIDDNEFESKSRLSAVVFSKKITLTNEPYYDQPLNLPQTIIFDEVDQNTYAVRGISYTNFSEVDEVKIKSIEIQQENLYIVNSNKEFVQMDLNKNASGNSSKIFEVLNFKEQQIKPYKSDSFQTYGVDIKFTPRMNTVKNIDPKTYVYYTGLVKISYEHKNAISKSTNILPSIKEIIIPITGISQKIK